MSEAIGDEPSAARALNNIGLVYWDLGRNEDALTALKRALAIHERLGPQANLRNTVSNVGLVLIELDRHPEGLTHLERVLRMDQEAGDLYGQAGVQQPRERGRRTRRVGPGGCVSRAGLTCGSRSATKEGIARSSISLGLALAPPGRTKQPFRCSSRPRHWRPASTT
jgi:tetratricopeptide (TPR) repeat protein